MSKPLIVSLSLFILAGLYTVFWYVGSEKMKHSIARWIQKTSSHSFNITHQRMKRHGFPFSVKWEIAKPNANFIVAGRKIGIVSQLVSVGVNIWQPSKIKLATQNFTISLKENSINGDILLGFSEFKVDTSALVNGQLPIKYRINDIQVSEITKTSTKKSRKAVGEAKTMAGIIQINQTQQPLEAKRTLNFSISIHGIKSGLQSLFDGTGALEAKFTLNGNVGEGRLEDIVEWREEGGTFDIASFGLKWHPIDLTFEGTASLDRQLRPIGAGAVRVRGTELFLDKQVLAGKIRKSDASLIKIALALATRADKFSNDSSLHLPITAQDGILKAGPFKLSKLGRIVR